MAEHDRLIQALNRNTEAVALVALLKDASRCIGGSCLAYATVSMWAYSGIGYVWCDACISHVIREAREVEASWREQDVTFTPREPVDLPYAKQVRRLTALMRGE
jgi:hypothetical protein